MGTHTRSRFLKGLMASAAAVALVAVPLDAVIAQDAQGHAAVPVSVTTVQPVEANTWDEFSGRLEAIERVDLRPRVAGQIVAIHFREGAIVKAGDSLVTIDPAPYAAEVDRLNGVVAAAEAQLVFTKADVARARQIIGSSALSERELDTRANAYDSAVANLRSAQAALQTAKLNLSWTEVRAPVAGRVGRREITVGNLVEAGSNAPLLTTLVSVNPIYASFNADENIVAKALATLSPEANASAHVEQIPVEMSTANDGVWRRGTLQLIDNKVDVASGTVRLRATFDNADGRLISGQFVRVRLAQPKTAPVLAISERAIGTDQDKKYVMVVGKDNRTAYREVKLGAMTDDLRIITKGLNAGDRVIVAGLQHVKPGDEVAPESVAMNGRPSSEEHAAADIPQQ